MKEPYKGNTDRANRLHAARKSAGFKSSREAAVRFGWHPGTYRAHEIAARHFDAETSRMYANAFGVSHSWLTHGRGHGPSIDPVRAARFELRRGTAKQPTQEAAGRLRVARRLAGYLSVTDASRKIGVKRSTLSAHENGQNDMSREAAMFYGKAFAVEPEWLLSGRLPSGLPAQAEAALSVLLSLHDQPESRALPHFSGLQREIPAPRFPRELASHARPKPSPHGDRVSEYTPLALFRKLSDIKQGSAASGEWFFPDDYLVEILHCQPNAAAVLTVPPRWQDLPSQHRLQLHPGSRLVLDTGSTSPLPDAYYAVVRAGGELRIGRRSKDGNEPVRLDPDERIAGTICGIVSPPLPTR